MMEKTLKRMDLLLEQGIFTKDEYEKNRKRYLLVKQTVIEFEQFMLHEEEKILDRMEKELQAKKDQRSDKIKDKLLDLYAEGLISEAALKGILGKL